MLTSLYANNLLEESVGRTQFPYVEGTFLSLFTKLPDEDDPSGIEVVGGNYARQIITWEVALNYRTRNDSTVIFPIASANWGTIVGIGVWNALTEGQLGHHGPVVTPQAINTGDQYQFSPASIVITVTPSS